MSSKTFERELEKLSKASVGNFLNPDSLVWPTTVEVDSWCFTPELISLFGTPAWEAMDEAHRKRLSFFEAVNFFSLNIHGEKFLISEISPRLYQDSDRALSEYLLHFVEEEAKHMMYFSGFCNRYAGKVYPDRSMVMGEKSSSEVETLLLFARIYVFEEIVDEYNQIMANDDRLVPVVREINRIHHVEESRHLAFGRKFIKEWLNRHAEQWDTEIHQKIRSHLSGFLQLTWKQYHNPDVYKDAGLEDAFGLWQTGFDQPVCQGHRNGINTKRLGLLRDLALLEPANDA